MLSVVFDLDDTLVFERDYVASGFRAVSKQFDDQNEQVYTLLWHLFSSGVRGDTFDRVLDRYPEFKAELSVRDMVRIYREHKPTISFIEGARQLLKELRSLGAPLALISDGPLVAQSNKVEALNLEVLVDEIVLTDRWGKAYWKPHPRAYEIVEARFPENDYCYIGDNPTKDFKTAYARGWKSIRLRLPEQLHERAPAEPYVLEYRSVAELRAYLLSFF